MKIAVLGATGLLGRHVVKEAFSRGIDLKVLVRDPSKLGDLQNQVEVVQGDYFNSEDQASTLEGVDLVVSTIGPPPVRKGSPKVEVYGDAMRSLVKVMKQNGLTRIVNVAGASASYPGEKIVFSRKLMRLMMHFMVPVITPAKELEIEILRSSGLAHTTVRPPMIAEGVKGQLKSSETDPQGMKVDAAQLAAYMLDVIEKPEWHGKLPFVATGN
ncbi:NAD(P)-dependent oxidoreductase [Photobacterium sp. OFAV2-7]|uniref:NAD(P)-dependent oxidoreductase n=1 Tax=Photobacterium sp. OFAV2-7 TaxID=2917748 RepID=UPI001EF3E332|nr:NAD(P)H-binding protein [Photobacterium sp. OFAV2-7]MCG7587583.1 NAD(P)H-binding protein [Photobacterium sp. OFAV2-7]